jgi:hypothetical protein
VATRWTALLAALVAAFAAACGDEEAGQPVPLEPASGIARVDARTPVIGVSEPNGWRREPAPASPDEIARLLADLGATSQRFVVDWSLVEPRAPVGGEHAYDFAAFDAMYEADLIHGIRPLLVVLNAPAWAWDPGAIGGALVKKPPAPDRLREWAALV